MKRRYQHLSSSPCRKRQSRRSFLGNVMAGTATGGILGCGGPSAETGTLSDLTAYDTAGRLQSKFTPSQGRLAMPGPFPGRVVEVGHAGSIDQGRRDPVIVKAMVDYGMSQLVPEAEDAVDAWRYFFERGDRVGIKVVPVGMAAKPGVPWSYEGPAVDLQRPGSISSYELVDEVVNGLTSAGVRPSDILVFDRYRNEFQRAGYLARLPNGVHWECCSASYDEAQLEIDGQLRGQPRRKNVSGYDRDVFRELPFCQPAKVHDPQDDRRFRSHLSKIVTQKVDKIVALPVLKDHRSAGVTLSLKNMSHGLVNNVARSHIIMDSHSPIRGGSLNHCQTFIPAAVSLPHTREKCVLQILDGLEGTYEGGPGNWNKTFSTWEYKALLFATDPVSLDQIGWEIIDAKRSQQGWPAVSQMGLDGRSGIKPEIHNDRGEPIGEQFHIRQPQHVPLASLLGLGTFDRNAIEHCKFQIG